MLLGTAILSVGIFNGVMLSLLLWFQKKDRFLAFGIFIYCMLLLKYLGYWVGFFEDHRIFAELLRPTELLMGPILYGVFHRLGGWPMKREWMHYLPFGILIVTIASYCTFNIYYFGEVEQFFPQITMASKMTHQVLYLTLLLPFRKKLSKPMVLIAVFYGFQWILSLAYALYRFNPGYEYASIVLFAGLAISVNYLAFVALRNSSVFDVEESKRLSPTSNKKDVDLFPIFEQLEIHIKAEDLFLNQNLKISDVSVALKISEKQISKSVNECAGENFNAYINRFRVGYAERLMKDSAYDNYTIDAIGLESGFANKVSFYKAFKRVHGVSPSVWKKGIPRQGLAQFAF